MKLVTINEKQYPALARYSSIKMFCDRKGIDFFEFHDLLLGHGIDKKNFQPTTKFIDDMSLLMLCFIERGCEASGTVFDLKTNDVIDWFLDGNITIVYELITEAQGQSKNVKAIEEKV